VFGEPALVEDEDLVGVHDRTQAVRDDQQRAAGGEFGDGVLDGGLDSGSAKALASSRMTIGVSASSARAMDTRWASPPDSRASSPTTES